MYSWASKLTAIPKTLTDFSQYLPENRHTGESHKVEPAKFLPTVFKFTIFNHSLSLDVQFVLLKKHFECANEEEWRQ
jgi:hypothetical protein